MTKINILDAAKHQQLRVNPDYTHAHVANQQMVPLLAAEFMRASVEFPIFFVKQEQTGHFKPVALMGTVANENLIFSGGKVRTNYIPANIRRYPFSAGAASPNSEEIVVCIDEASTWLNEKEGFALFNESGQASKEVQQVGEMLVDMLAKDQATDIFVNCLQDFELLERADINLNLSNGEKVTLAGIYKISEDKLNKLEDEKVLLLHKKHYFAAIHAHLSSINQINKLLALKSGGVAE